MANLFSTLRKLFSSRKKTVLIVDDSLVDRRVVQHIVSKKYPILLARDGQEGIDLAKERMPDLIILDYSMPGLTGADVIRILKKDEMTMNIPIVILTTASIRDISSELLQLGASALLQKPVEPDTLLKQIASLL
jgi:CheY-like chemotaxis protein